MKKILLIISLSDINDKIIETLTTNIANKYIDNIIILLENQMTKDLLIQSDKISIIKVDTKQTFKVMTGFSQKNVSHEYIIIANANVIFDNTIQRISELEYNKNLCALSSWIKTDENNYMLELKQNKSIGCCIFKNEVKNDNVNLINPCIDIRTYCNYTLSDDIFKDVITVNPRTIDGLTMSNVTELHIGQHIIKKIFTGSDFNSNKAKYITTDLCHTMQKYGSDKGTSLHNYTRFYDYIFKDIKHVKLNVFELGLGTNNLDVVSNMGRDGKPGASLFGWREYFKNSNIYGGDIDKRILFSDKNIKTYYCDQTNPEIIKDMWNNDDLKNIEFDIIVEDGLHTFKANYTFLVNSLYKLKKGGVYIIEDLEPFTWARELLHKNMYFLDKSYTKISLYIYVIFVYIFSYKDIIL